MLDGYTKIKLRPCLPLFSMGWHLWQSCKCRNHQSGCWGRFKSLPRKLMIPFCDVGSAEEKDFIAITGKRNKTFVSRSFCWYNVSCSWMIGDCTTMKSSPCPPLFSTAWPLWETCKCGDYRVISWSQNSIIHFCAVGPCYHSMGDRYLEDNKITSLSATIFDRLTSLKYLWVWW